MNIFSSFSGILIWYRSPGGRKECLECIFLDFPSPLRQAPSIWVVKYGWCVTRTSLVLKKQPSGKTCKKADDRWNSGSGHVLHRQRRLHSYFFFQFTFILAFLFILVLCMEHIIKFSDAYSTTLQNRKGG